MNRVGSGIVFLARGWSELMSSERGGVDRPTARESIHTPGRAGEEGEVDEGESLLEQIPDGHPACLDHVDNVGGDRWFLYQGEFLFDRSTIPIIAERLELISETDFDPPERMEATIKWWETADFIEEVERRWEAVKEDHSFLVAVPTPGITQETDPRRTIVEVEYPYHRSDVVTERDWKQAEILATLREFDYWVYHTEIIEPAVETVSL